jgi:hypothetical protein
MIAAGAARLKHFGWGREGEGLSAEEEAFILARGSALRSGADGKRQRATA